MKGCHWAGDREGMHRQARVPDEPHLVRPRHHTIIMEPLGAEYVTRLRPPGYGAAIPPFALQDAA